MVAVQKKSIQDTFCSGSENEREVGKEGRW